MTRDEIESLVCSSWRGTSRSRGARGLGPAALLFAVAAVLLFGCGRADEPTDLIRLIDELSGARIDTPLEGLQPWETVQRGLADRPFWQPELRPGRQVYRACRRIGEFRLECKADQGERYAVVFEVPTEPHSYYRVEVRVWSPDRRCARLRIGDLREARDLDIPERANEWQLISESWRTGGTEDTLRIAFRGTCAVRIDSLQVREVIVDRAGELAALAARARSPFGGVGLGMVKFGSLLPHDGAETVGKPFDENWGYREAILAPAPTDITYSLRVPEDGRLRFSYAMSDMSRVGDRTRFEVLAGARGAKPTVLWSAELALTAANWHWHEARVDLQAWARRKVDLTLRTRTAGERGYAIWGTPTIDSPRRVDEPPNIVLIAVDTLRADRLSSYGYEKPTSPNLDALARDGVLFLNPISQSTQTSPSFASMFTGQLVARHGFLFATSVLAPTVPTLARVLRQNGWTTHGAMFHAALYDHSLARGFERYFNLPRTRHRADQNLEKALDWLEANGDRRFFFFLHFSDPHQPFTQPPEFVHEETAASLADYGVELPFNVKGSIGDCAPCTAKGVISADFRRIVRELYDEEVNYVDDQIGVFLQDLKDRDLYDDTIVVFVSDHGETLWDHFDYFDHGGVNQHDELTRVPLIIKPARGLGYTSGTVVRTQVQVFDLMPTLLEMVGVNTSLMTMDARSLMPLLREDAGSGRYEGSWAYCSNEQATSVRGRGWKWTWARRVGEGLFNLENDPLETTDVAADNPTVLRGMRSRYMETLLGSAGGSYLLVLDDGEDYTYRLRVLVPGAGQWKARPVDTLGLRLSQNPEPEVWIYRGTPLLDGLVLFARLPPSAEPPVVVVTRTGVDSGRVSSEVVDLQRVGFRGGEISRLLAAGPPGVYLVEAPTRSLGDGDDNLSQLDTAQEKALRALGYIQ